MLAIWNWNLLIYEIAFLYEISICEMSIWSYIVNKYQQISDATMGTKKIKYLTNKRKFGRYINH